MSTGENPPAGDAPASSLPQTSTLERAPSRPTRSRLAAAAKAFTFRGSAETIVTRGGLLSLLLLGLAVYRHFGISWDEWINHVHGQLLLEFLLDGDTAGLRVRRFYGPAFVLPLGLIDRFTNSDPLEYQLGHLLGYLLFVAAVSAMYGLCKRQFGAWGWGVLGAAFLVASPRVFSHAFVNPKDAPIMALTVIAFYSLVRFLESRELRWIVATAAASALAIDIRVNAVFIVALTGLALAMDAVGTKDRREAITSFVVPLGAYVGVLVPLVVLFWPYLWSDPIGHALSAFREMSHYGIARAQSTLVYKGQQVSASALPWHYIPWWIAISTPIPYLVLAGVGLFSVPLLRVRDAVRERSVDRILLLYLAWFLGPLLYVVMTHAVLYNEWRQMLFLYPPVVVFAVAGAVRMSRWVGPRIVRPRLGSRTFRLRLQTVFVTSVLVVLGWVAFRMAELHPYQAVYFNSLVGGAEGAQGRYTMDYWGLSYKEGLDYVLRSTNGRVRYWACTLPGRHNRLMFPKRERARLVHSRRRVARYALCTNNRRDLRRYPTVYSVSRDGATILYVKDLRAS